MQEDFLKSNYHTILPLRKSLAKQLAKQSMRTEKALNLGCLFKRCHMEDVSSG